MTPTRTSDERLSRTTTTTTVAPHDDSHVRHRQRCAPSDPTDAANYTVTSTACTFDTGVSLESGKEGSWQYGERGQYLPTLGVVLMTQHTGKMLAYRPA